MYSDLFSQKSVQDLLTVLPSLPLAVWETFYVTVVSTALSLVIGLPLGVLLVVGEKNGVLPLPRWLMQVLNVIINLLRSIPFLILMILVIPVTRAIAGKAYGSTATIVPLVIAAAPYVARMIESSLLEVDPGVIEAAQSMGANIPTIIFVNKIDQNGIDLQRVYQSIKDKLTSDRLSCRRFPCRPKYP